MSKLFKLIVCMQLLITRQVMHSQFTAGNLVVLQAGTGNGPLLNSGNPIILKEFNTAGLPTFSMAIPTASSPLIVSGTAVSEGGLSLSPNGKLLVFAGYATGLTFSSPLNGATASALNRGIGIVNAAGNYSRIATSSTFYSANSIRSAASDGQNNYWAAGGNAGANYFGITAPAATIQNSITNTRNVIAFNGDLYFSTASGNPGIYRVGAGFPINTGQTCSMVVNAAINGSGSPSPYAFFFNNTFTVCYVADDRTPSNNGGIQKWVFASNSWSLAYTLPTGAPYGARGLVVDFSNPNPRVFATTSESAANRLVSIVDAGSGSTATTLATASPGTIFRGVAFSPYCSGVTIDSLHISGPVCAGLAFQLNTDITGTAPVTYSWSGPSGFASALQSPTLTAGLSGSYTVSVTNGCGSDAKEIYVSVNPLPLVTANSSTICNGGSALLSATGAGSYSWSNGASGSSQTVNPTVTTNYTVTGTSVMGCPASFTTFVTVVDTLQLVVNSATLCAGDTAALCVSGATSYTWGSGSNATVIIVSPGVTSVYSVLGSASGCAAPALATPTVTVNPLPLVYIQPVPALCLNEAAIDLTAQPPGGTFSGPGVSGTNFYPSLLSPGNFVVTYMYTSSDNCTDSDSTMIFVDPCLGNVENKAEISVKLFPNPAADYLLVVPGIDPGTTLLEIIDGKGSRMQDPAWVNDEGIDVSCYPPGIYSLIFKTRDGPKISRFIKE